MHASRRRSARTTSWALLLVAVAVVAGCESDAPAPLHLMPGAVYRSRPGNFTCVVPPLTGPGGIREAESATDDTAAGVTFGDDFGNLLDVQSVRPAAEPTPATAADDFDHRVLVAWREKWPALSVLHRDTVPVSVGPGVTTPAVFAVVDLPGGATAGPDSTRGVLSFAAGRWVYTVSVQLWPRTPNQPPLAPPDRDERLLADARHAVERMSFN